MIISDATSNRSVNKFVLLATSLAIVVVLLYLFLPFNSSVSRSTIPGTFYCDMEVTESDYFTSSGIQFDGGKTQNGDYSRSGKYSCFLKKAKENQYGVGFKLPDFKPGEMYKASVWRYREKGGDDGNLVVSGNGEGEFYKATKSIIKSVSGWELLEIIFRIPSYKTVDQISIYVFSEGHYPLYFDDLLVQKTSDGALPSNTSWSPQTIQLQLEEKAIRKLNEKRNQAFQNGILESSDDDWVKTKIINKSDNKKIKASLRLKGDWLDHLEDDKWSFRVKTKTGETFNRLRYFSLHTPKARAYLLEWVLHELFKQEDILTTYYDFLIVELNEKQQGVYAIEEHFDKVLLERQKRREGPIVRFSEDGFWAGMKRQTFQTEGIDHEVKINIKTPQAAPTTPFQEKKTISDKALHDQFEQAVILLEQYKQGQTAVEDVFDIESMAKYFAICDAFSAHHGIAWHNQRFYFNPVTGKLEPIGFDGFGEVPSLNNTFLGMGALNKRKVDKENIENFFFLDESFTRLYSFYLEKYTSRVFLNSFFAKIEEELVAREALLKTEFENYRFDLPQLIINAQRMHLLVLPYNEYSLRAYTQKVDKENKIIKVANFHSLPVEVIGAGKTSALMTDTFDQKSILEAYFNRKILSKRLQDTTAEVSHREMVEAHNDQEPVTYSQFSTKKENKYLFFKPLGIDSVFYTTIHDWKLDDGPTIHQSIFNNISLTSNEVYSVSDGLVFFKNGQHQVSESIVIPEGYRVIFEEGCQIDFIKKASFLSKSPVFMNGTEEEPIIIYSSDKSATGFSILQAPEESILHYTSFDQFNTLLKKGWTLTGAVTFYESDVLIDHCVFKNNLCEDALNIIRSEFNIENSLISNTFSDGFDSDFCKGTIKRTNFLNTGNDGMDFSGSVIFIEDVHIQKAGDKGVSVGEDTDASITNISIKDSNIAVAAKDLSMLIIEDIEMTNCSQGFIAFQKKPEYGGANIIIKKYSAENIKRLYNIREGSTLQLEGKIIAGEKLEN
jgi:CotH protein